VLVGVPQRSKFGGSGAKFGGSWECNIAKLATSFYKKYEILYKMKIYVAAMLYKKSLSLFPREK
jgi:hypothetical protein